MCTPDEGAILCQEGRALRRMNVSGHRSHMVVWRHWGNCKKAPVSTHQARASGIHRQTYHFLSKIEQCQIVNSNDGGALFLYSLTCAVGTGDKPL